MIAIFAIVGGSAGLKDWREKQREVAAVAKEQAEDIRLDRLRRLYWWSPGGVEVYGVELVKAPDEVRQAVEQLTQGAGSDYAVVRVNERPNGNQNRANDLRNSALKAPYTPREDFRGVSDDAELRRISARIGVRPASS